MNRRSLTSTSVVSAMLGLGYLDTKKTKTKPKIDKRKAKSKLAKKARRRNRK